MWPTKEFPFLWFCIWIMFVILFNSKTVPCWITWSMTLFKACCDVVMLNPIQLQMYFLIIGWLYRYKGNPNREVTSQINSLLWILHTFILLGRLFTYIYKLIPPFFQWHSKYWQEIIRSIRCLKTLYSYIWRQLKSALYRNSSEHKGWLSKSTSELHIFL